MRKTIALALLIFGGATAPARACATLADAGAQLAAAGFTLADDRADAQGAPLQLWTWPRGWAVLHVAEGCARLAAVGPRPAPTLHVIDASA